AKQLEAVGVTLDLVHNEWFMYLDRVRGGGYDLARGGWIGDYLDPRTFLAMFRTDDPDNQTGWSSARYDALLQLADDPAGLANAPTRWAKLYEDAVDGTRLRDALKDVRAAGNARLKRRALSELRMALLYEAEVLLIEGAPIIPLYQYRGNGLLRPGVTGFHPNVLSHHPIRELRRN
nr:hypothetical protein [Planctomycetota bacterium]